MNNIEIFDCDNFENAVLDEMVKNDRFTMNPDETQMIDINNSVLSKDECKKYIEKERIVNTTVSEELNVGDVVMIKDGKVPFTIVATKNTTDTQGFDYYGQIEGNTNYYLFDQQDIESIVERKSQHLK